MYSPSLHFVGTKIKRGDSDQTLQISAEAQGAVFSLSCANWFVMPLSLQSDCNRWAIIILIISWNVQWFHITQPFVSIRCCPILFANPTGNTPSRQLNIRSWVFDTAYWFPFQVFQSSNNTLLWILRSKFSNSESAQLSCLCDPSATLSRILVCAKLGSWVWKAEFGSWTWKLNLES